MKEIYFNRSNHYDIFLKNFIKNGGNFDERLKIKERNFGIGVFAKKYIESFSSILSIPEKLFISKDVFKNFLLEKKIIYPDIDFLERYFSLLPDYNFFKLTHPLLLNSLDREIMLSCLKNTFSYLRIC